MIDFVVGAIVVAAVGSALTYIIRAKKKGECIGCPEGGSCSGCSCRAGASGCGGNAGGCHTDGK